MRNMKRILQKIQKYLISKHLKTSHPNLYNWKESIQLIQIAAYVPNMLKVSLCAVHYVNIGHTGNVLGSFQEVGKIEPLIVLKV